MLLLKEDPLEQDVEARDGAKAVPGSQTEIT
jgi:hypothetical protein